MTKETAKSQINHRLFEVALRNEINSCGGEIEQMHAIARHYTSLMATAIQLKKLLDMNRFQIMSQECTMAARHLSNQIKTSHAYDLGIELKWGEEAPAGDVDMGSDRPFMFSTPTTLSTSLAENQPKAQPSP